MKPVWRELTAEETRILVNRGTEAPFSGRFTRHAEKGVYTCRRCGAALYRAEDKFDAGCGWPAFDDAVPGAITRLPDADGRRTEIRCFVCGGHLGHVFTGERLTARDVRHCVNSLSMDFVADAQLGGAFERAVFAGGCFWGVEYYLQQARGVIRAVSGYTGGRTERPTYRQVCAGDTGHAEAVEVLYDPRQTDYETLARLFFEIHDPTQTDRQGPDLGEQYRSAVFVLNPGQRAIAERLIARLRAKGFEVVTRVEPAARFWPAESGHQDYYFVKGSVPYCHRPVNRFGE
ncbi:MAG: bifunctional methionine sulfoxide reductase B/A protein [Kiritimatiellia bacterium]|jgi:peptide methionine sulfoxide reductase msrA/msrB|nr:bifunctional methionine sulfoxide reductase B/A protein [Kiritimatiellia bacterium]